MALSINLKRKKTKKQGTSRFLESGAEHYTGSEDEDEDMEERQSDRDFIALDGEGDYNSGFSPSSSEDGFLNYAKADNSNIFKRR